jgi:transcriptional regulator with XRE-family HTH domain
MAGTGKGATKRQRELGARIRTRRLDLGLSQEALAHQARIDRSYVGSLEAGMRNPSLDTLCKIAKALAVDVGELLSGLQNMRGRT